LKHYAGHQSERGQKMVDNQSFRKNALKTLDLSWKSQFQRFKFFQSSQLTPLRTGWQQSCNTPPDDAVKQFSPEPWRKGFFAALLDLHDNAYDIAGLGLRIRSALVESKR
jgi:hypothetical protein